MLATITKLTATPWCTTQRSNMPMATVHTHTVIAGRRRSGRNTRPNSPADSTAA